MNRPTFNVLSPFSDLTSLDLKILHSIQNDDNRGRFREAYKKSQYDLEFVPQQLNFAYSSKNVFRGLHKSNQQNKIVSCVFGEIMDIVVDLRPKSITYGTVYSLTLNSHDPISFFVPIGYGHGYLVLSNDAIVSYLVDHEYVAGEEECFYGLDIVKELTKDNESTFILSEKDLNAPRIST